MIEVSFLLFYRKNVSTPPFVRRNDVCSATRFRSTLGCMLPQGELEAIPQKSVLFAVLILIDSFVLILFNITIPLQTVG
jgi:hypothetical protein